jgi:hypothetical protein
MVAQMYDQKRIFLDMFKLHISKQFFYKQPRLYLQI